MKKRWLQKFLHGTGIEQILAKVYCGPASVLMFHRIVPLAEQSLNSDLRSLEISPEHVKSIVRWLRSEGFKIVPLAEVVTHILNPDGVKRVALTFDDGFRDNFTIGAQLFQELDVPFTVFVTTGFTDREAVVWWYALDKLLREGNHILDLEGIGIDKKVIPAELSEDQRLELYRSAKIDAWTSDLSSWFTTHTGKNPLNLTTTLTASWDDLRNALRCPLLTLGAHTLSHPRLSSLPAAAVEKEISGSKKRLEEMLSISVPFFAYPFGDRRSCGPREFAIAKSLGFQAAFTTSHGHLFTAHGDHLFALPRVHVTENGAETLAGFQLRFQGLGNILHEQGRRVVWG